MNFYRLNHEKSLNLINKTEDLEAKACYNNVFYALFHNEDLEQAVDAGEISICYGYLRIFKDANVWVRHCFFKTEKGEVLDPTIGFLNLDLEDLEYIVFKEFTDFYTYHEALQHDTSDLSKTFAKEEGRFCLEQAQAGRACIS